ncbi:hypothetical protein [Aquimarina sp. 2304DJ70-9]|uniref:hypothetical protein n=1 Tax=Aquimarina penaris TaxID=3231044 RepID=UPI003461A13F
MKKLLKKSILYGFLLIISLEILVRIFYLGKDNPTRYLDQYDVEKWKPNQHGFSVTGNRKQNFSEYKINSSGFNSYREYTPTKDKVEIAIVGDSFIEGFHQDYFNSIGKKVEGLLPKTEVYEYGYAGYDMADQLHLIHKYKEQFDVIDHVVIYIRFSDDLTRNTYTVVKDRLALESPINKTLKKSKLLVYTKSIGVFTPLKQLISRVKGFVKGKTPIKKASRTNKTNHKKDKKYIDNFKHLTSTYGYDKDRFVLLLDVKATSPLFISYLKENHFDYIDFSKAFEASDQDTTLIYDQHWNNHGRDIIATMISNYLRGK